MIKEFRQRGAHGFSLVEMMIVVAIIAILAAIAVPSISEYIRRSKGRDVARSIANSVRFARDQAMSRGQVVLVEIDPSASGDRGVVRVLRLVDTSGGGGDAGSGDGGSGSSAASLPKSCKEASWKLSQGTLNTETAYEYDIGQKQPDMAIRQMDPDPETTMRLCAMPDGRVGTMNGLPFRPNDSADCTDQEFRIGVALEGESLTPQFGSNALNACVPDGDPETEASVYETHMEQKNSRDLVNYWMITVSYNGSVDAMQ